MATIREKLHLGHWLGHHPHHKPSIDWATSVEAYIVIALLVVTVAFFLCMGLMVVD